MKTIDQLGVVLGVLGIIGEGLDHLDHLFAHLFVVARFVRQADHQRNDQAEPDATDPPHPRVVAFTAAAGAAAAAWDATSGAGDWGPAGGAVGDGHGTAFMVDTRSIVW